jgi:thymidylate synthase
MIKKGNLIEQYDPYQTQYYNLLAELLLDPDKNVKSRNGQVHSNFVRQLRIELKHEFPLMDIKHVSFNNIVHELLWFLKGETNIKYLIDNKCNIWNDDAFRWYNEKFVPAGAPECTKEEFIEKVLKEEILDEDDFYEDTLSPYTFEYKYGDLGQVYGQQWRNFNYDHDQLEHVIEALQKTPDTRQDLIVTSQNPEDQYSGAMALPPCHNYFQFYTEPIKEGEGRYISLYFNMRSCDVFLGNPYNVASYSLLLKIIAQIVGMVPKTVVCNMVDCHLYEIHNEAAKEWMLRYEKRYNVCIENEKVFPPILNKYFGGKSSVQINPDIKKINDFKFSDFKLINYSSEGAIKAQLLT